MKDLEKYWLSLLADDDSSSATEKVGNAPAKQAGNRQESIGGEPTLRYTAKDTGESTEEAGWRSMHRLIVEITSRGGKVEIERLPDDDDKKS